MQQGMHKPAVYIKEMQQTLERSNAKKNNLS